MIIIILRIIVVNNILIIWYETDNGKMHYDLC